MKYLSHTRQQIPNDVIIGGKAKNLFRLVAMGMQVPQFVVIPQEVLAALIPSNIQTASHEVLLRHINSIAITTDEIAELTAGFRDTRFFAVRSSAIDEDGAEFSFAGQFATHLFVTPDQLADKIKSVWCSAFSEQVIQYRNNNKLEHKFGIAVIIQEMVDAEVAGGGFWLTPFFLTETRKNITTTY